MLVIAYFVAIIAATVEAKRRWQLSFKPEELMPAGIFGTLSTFGLSVVLLPLDRTNTIFAITRIPFERAVKFHRWAGSAALFMVVAHGIMEAFVQGFAEMWKIEAKAWGFGNIFGTAAGLCCIALALASTNWARRVNYGRFLPVHRALAAAVFLAGALHCFAFLTLAAACLLLHCLGKFARWLRRYGPANVVRSRRIGCAEADSEALFLEVEWPGQGCPPAGVWYLLRVPGSNEWHPFSVAAAEPGTLGFLIKNMGNGTWTQKITEQTPAALMLEGPYGGPAFSSTHCRQLLLVAGGVGITSMARLWRDPPEGVSRVTMLWVVRCPEATEWLVALLPEYASKSGIEGESIRIFVTRQSSRERDPGITWAAGVNSDDMMAFAPEEDRAVSVDKNLRDQPRTALLEQSGTWERCRSNLVSSPSVAADGGCSAENNFSAMELNTIPSEWSRQHTWEVSRDALAGGSQLAQRAADLSWDPNAPPLHVGPHVVLKAGRPDMSQEMNEAAGSVNNGPNCVVMACGPHQLVEEVRLCSARLGLRFHAEEFAF